MLKRFALPVADAVAMTGFLVPQAVAEEPASASQCEVVQVIESGTLKWGVKESVRLFVCGGLGLQVVRESVGVSHG
ncbi:hypothetical protein CHUV2995_00755 [Corynebacterium diphtheriae subsp. lausannense]|nr:hypothetical protein CHUV2995_00755 [Corynebacterium diphtheriae subsp. lausannense]